MKLELITEEEKNKENSDRWNFMDNKDKSSNQKQKKKKIAKNRGLSHQTIKIGLTLF